MIHFHPHGVCFINCSFQANRTIVDLMFDHIKILGFYRGFSEKLKQKLLIWLCLLRRDVTKLLSHPQAIRLMILIHLLGTISGTHMHCFMNFYDIDLVDFYAKNVNFAKPFFSSCLLMDLLLMILNAFIVLKIGSFVGIKLF